MYTPDRTVGLGPADDCNNRPVLTYLRQTVRPSAVAVAVDATAHSRPTWTGRALEHSPAHATFVGNAASGGVDAAADSTDSVGSVAARASASPCRRPAYRKTCVERRRRQSDRQCQTFPVASTDDAAGCRLAAAAGSPFRRRCGRVRVWDACRMDHLVDRSAGAALNTCRCLNIPYRNVFFSCWG